jgi:hypothetical protein
MYNVPFTIFQLSAALASTFASQISPSAISQQLSLGIRPALPPAQTNSLAQALAEALAQSLATPPAAAAANFEEEQPMDLTNSTDQQSPGQANDSPVWIRVFKRFNFSTRSLPIR